MPKFWKQWLTIWCWIIIAFGIILTGAAFQITSAPTRFFYDLLDGPGQLRLYPHTRFSIALMGAITIGWGLTLLAIVQAASQLGKKIWIPTTIAISAWYVIDGILSIATGFGLNVIPNTILFAGFLIPVIQSGALKK